MITTPTPIIYRGYRITVSRDKAGHVGWTELPGGETRGEGFVMHSTTYTHTYPNAEQALAAAIAVVDTRELRQAR